MPGFNKRFEGICKDIFIQKQTKKLDFFFTAGRKKDVVDFSIWHNLYKQVQVVNFRFKMLSNAAQKTLELWSHVPCYRLRLILPCTGLQSVVSGHAPYYLIYYALQDRPQASQKPIHLLGLFLPDSLSVYPFFPKIHHYT